MMGALLLGLLIASLLLLPGLVVLAAGAGRGAGRWPWPQGLAVAAATSVAATGLVAIGLGTAGLFSLRAEIAAVALLSAAIAGAGGFRLAWPLAAVSPTAGLGTLLLVVLGALAFLGRPFEMLIGGQDAATYTVAGIALSRQGSIILQDRAAAKIGAEAQRAIYPPPPRDPARAGWPEEVRKFGGFTYADVEHGWVRTQGFHLLPGLIAVFHAGFGLPGAFAANNVLGITAVLSVLGLGSLLVGDAAALLGATLLTIDLVQVWSARYPVAEILLQLLVCGGLAAFLRGGWLGEALAGFLFGAAFFAKVDAILLLIPIAGLAAVSWRRPPGRRRAPFWAAVTAMLLLAAPYWLTQHADYVGDVVRNVRRFQTKLLPLLGTPAAVAAVAVLMAAGAWLVLRRRGAGSRRASRPLQATLARALAVAVGIAALYGYFLRPSTTSRIAGETQTLVWLGWYVTPPVLLAAVAGLAGDLWSRLRGRALFATVTLLTPTVVFLYVTFVHVHHIYLTRRFVPTALPLLFLFFGSLVLHVASSRRLGRAGTAVAAIAAVAAAGAVFERSRYLYPHREYAGATQQLARLADRLRGADVVLLSDTYSRDLLGPALEFVFDVPVIAMGPGRYRAASEVLQGWLDRGWTVAALTQLAPRVELPGLPGGEDFELVGRVRLDLPVLVPTRNHFPRRRRVDHLHFLRYAAGPGADPLFGFWRAHGEEVCTAVGAAPVRLIGGNRYLLRRVKSRCAPAAEAKAAVGFLFGPGEMGTADGARFERHDIAGAVLLSALAPLAGRPPLAPAGWKVSTEPPTLGAERATDGVLDTRWRSPAPRRHGMRFTVEFPGPMDISWARIRMGRYFAERARALRIETSTDGRRWDRVPQPLGETAEVWNEDGTSAESARGDADVWVNRRGIRFLRLENLKSSPRPWSIAELTLEGSGPAGAETGAAR